ncbi:Bug family tripartite tricarboxylate transporter substrate binding protein [Bradyrhizobium erythrophlei]|uniref:Tripartite-type tricarboxylate transporter, receptor component TctC n=1 Tax=Bradyrhizobium erythrophlei TaxID=1437360 RepID=A0A1M7U243_9BRAD|nr:tripartite tricarboxylate transporter substrate binding protein [Bradyrhizobium erythrophlei]SHN76920.1 Tripartite-type tricarboxylate transporter, receptor component TctC [Bradyrhizobium erythrophlei]
MRSVIAAIAAVLLCAHTAAAQNFPNRSITLVVAAAAGGTTDVLARIVARRMSEDLGQSVIVENVTGGGATVGTRRVVRSDADGYTLTFGNMGSLAANFWLFPNLGFDPRQDLAAVGLVAIVPMVLAVSKKSGIRDMAGLIAALKAKPGALNFGHAGPGTTTHLAAVTFLHVTGTQAHDIPYRGSAPAVNDLVAGTIDAVIDQTVTMIPMHTGGNVTAIATSSSTRLAQIPDVPTFAEAGVPAFDLTVWNAIAAPAATPRPVLERLESSLKTALADPDLRQRFAELAADIPQPDQIGAEPLRRLIASDIERFGPIIKAVGVKLE